MPQRLPSQPPDSDRELFAVDASTIVRRTPAGDAERAAPAQGLSITQRRILTLLDTPLGLDDLARRAILDLPRVEREAARLAQAGLVACEDRRESVEPHDALATTTVRLGASRPSRGLPVMGVVAATAVLAWSAWQYLSPPKAATIAATRAASAVPPQLPNADASAEPAPIATRTLRGEVPDRSREKDARPAAPAADANQARSVAPAVERSAPAIAPTVHSAPSIPGPDPETKPAHDGVAANASNGSNTANSAGSAHGLAATSAPAEQAAAAPVNVPAPPTTSPVAGASAPVSATVEPSIQLATAAPIPPVRAAPPKLVPITRETPEFPREAIAAGVSQGNVKARLTVDAQGHVTNVEILEATPHRVFDRAVRNALSNWQFEAGAGSRSTTVDIAFKRD